MEPHHQLYIQASGRPQELAVSQLIDG